jgi:hypothetical protein
LSPKDRKPEDADDFGPGMRTDGSVNVMTVEQAAIARAERDAGDAVFDEVLDGEDDLSDLDDIGDLP